MFNQSASKFSSSKLSIAVSSAILGLFFSSGVHSYEAIAQSGDYQIVTNPSGAFQIKSEIISSPEKSYLLAVSANAANVQISGSLLKLSALEGKVPDPVSQEGKKATHRFIGVLNQAKANLSVEDFAIDLSLAPQRNVVYSWYGISSGAGTTLNLTSSSIEIANNVVGEGEFDGVMYNVFNSGKMNLEAKEAELSLSIDSSIQYGQFSEFAAIYSRGKGDFSSTGESLKIKILDNSKGVENRIVQGVRVSGGKAIFSTNSLLIEGESSGGYIYGIYSQNKDTELTVTSDTKIDVNSSQAGNAYGLFATAGGTLTVDGNLEVHADKAIAVRSVFEVDADKKPTGNFVPSEVVVNSSGDKTVKLYGDIDYNISSDATQHVNGSKVTVNLTGENSVWEGHTTITLNNGVVDKEGLKTAVKDGLAIEVNLKDGAKWVPDNSSTLDKGSQQTNVIPLAALSLDNGVIELTDRSGDVVNVTELRGTGGEVHAQVAIDENSNITSNKLSIKKTVGTPSLAVHAKGITADDVKDRQAAMESFYANALFLDKEATANTELHIPEGDVAGKLRGTVDSENNVTVQENPHTISSSVLSIASSNYLSFRSQINDVASRLGDLRSMPKTAGAWVRYYGGQTKYSDRGMKEDYNTIQIGGDGFIADKYYLGGTFSYTDGNGTLVNGSSDDKNYNFGIYGGWLGEKGQFVDVIVKRHRIKSDFDLFNALGKSSGSYRTWGTSASIEAGWRLQCPANGFYAEPQAEFMLGHVESVNFKTNRGVRIHQDGINSAIGRVGVAFGYTFSENKGNAYAKASVLHDWKGDVKASYSKDGVSRRMHDDLGGTWGEFAVGATYNPIKNLSAYGQFKTTTGSPIRTPWQASIGVRYSF